MSNTNNTDRSDLNSLPHTTSFNSASAYASAESSPRHSLTPSQSASSLRNFSENNNITNSLQNGNTESDMYKSANSSANNSFNDLVQEASSTSTLSSMSSASVVGANSLSLSSTNVKQIIDETIHANLGKQPQQPIAPPTSAQSSMAVLNTSPAPTTKASVLSFIEKMFVKASPPPNQTKTAATVVAAAAAAANGPTSLPAKDLTVLQSSSISSSSPNPECSPYKLLDNELAHQQQQQQQQQHNHHSPNYQMKPLSGSTLSPNGTTINDAVAIFNASMHASTAAAAAAAAAVATTSTSNSSTMTVESLKKTTINCPEGTIVNSSSKIQQTTTLIPSQASIGGGDSLSTNKIIESLALLNNHKEHERADPVLQSSIPLKNITLSSASASSVTILSSVNVENATLLPKQRIEEISSKPSFDSISTNHHESVKTASSSHIDVPASSRDFCMDINFNLAAAAAVFAAAPVVISDNTKLPSTEAKSSENECTSKLTWNASTSSIHNDLKMILEESKKGVNGDAKEESSSTLKDKPKPQRVSQHNNRDKLVGGETNENDGADLIKTMMKMIENNKLGVHGGGGGGGSSTRRYTNEVLHQIRNERAEFIEKIMPDIFKAYCYCTTGKSWDPEKYFDVVQFPGEDFEKIQRQREERKSFINSNNNSNGQVHSKNRNNSHSGTNSYQRKPNSTTSTTSAYNKKKPNHSVSSNGIDSMQLSEHHQPRHLQPSLSVLESPEQSLPVPKNSPKSQQQNKSSSSSLSKGANGISNKPKKSATFNFKSEFGPSVFLNIVSDEQTRASQVSDDSFKTESGGPARTNADKILMGLLNKTPVSSKSSDNINLLDLINPSNINNSSKPVVQRRSSQRTSLEPPLAGSPNTSSNSGSAKKYQASPKSVSSNHISIDNLFGLNNNNVLSNILGTQKPSNPPQPRHYPKIYSAQELEMSQLIQPTYKEKHSTINNRQKDTKETVTSTAIASTSPSVKSPTTKSTSVNELFGLIDPSSSVVNGSDSSNTLDLNNNSNAYKQLVKNLSNHPLSAPPAKFDKSNGNFFKTQAKKQPTTTTTTPVESSNILKQLLNINLEANNLNESHESEKKKSTSSSSSGSVKKSSSHQHTKKNKSPKDKNNSMTNDSKSTETFKHYKDSKFPTVNPHERPFQSLSSFDAHKLHDSSLSMTGGSGGGIEETNPFENLIIKMKQSQLNQILEINKQELDLKKKKVHLSTEYEHFNSLLNKIMPSLTVANTTLPASSSSSSSNMTTSASTSFLSHSQYNERNMNTSASSHNILKWFDNSVKH